MKHLVPLNFKVIPGNGPQFKACLKRTLARAKRHKRIFAVALVRCEGIDLAAAGTDTELTLIETIRERLEGSLREEDASLWLGHNLFGLLLEELSERQDLDLVATRIMRRFLDPFIIHKQKKVIRAYMGLSVFPWHGKGGDNLMKTAHQALEQAHEQKSAAAHPFVIASHDHEDFEDTGHTESPTFTRATHIRDIYRKDAATTEIKSGPTIRYKA